MVVSKRIFISHSSKDKQRFVKRLVSDLRKNGFLVWYDEWSMKPGVRLRDKINEAISYCDYFIVILSSYSINSSWVQLELDSAMIRELEEKRVIVIPILVGRLDASKIPNDLKGKKFVDFRNLDSDKYNRAFAELIQGFYKGEDYSPNGYPLPPYFISHLELDEIEFLRLLFQSSGVASAFDLAMLSYGATAKSLNVIKRKASKIKKVSEKLQNPDREISALIDSSVEQTSLFEYEDMIYFFKDEKCFAFVEDYLEQNDPFFSKYPAIMLCGYYVGFIRKSINQLGEIIFDEDSKEYMNTIFAFQSCGHKERIENLLESMSDIGGSFLFGGKRIPDFQFAIPLGNNKTENINMTKIFFGDLFKESGCSLNIVKI